MTRLRFGNELNICLTGKKKGRFVDVEGTKGVMVDLDFR